MSETKRKVIDCRLHPSERGCTLSIEGTEEEVLEAAVQHAVTAHGHTNSPDLREEIKTIMKDVRE
jgi:predicted small metal-binding protein